MREWERLDTSDSGDGMAESGRREGQICVAHTVPKHDLRTAWRGYPASI